MGYSLLYIAGGLSLRFRFNPLHLASFHITSTFSGYPPSVQNCPNFRLVRPSRATRHAGSVPARLGTPGHNWAHPVLPAPFRWHEGTRERMITRKPAFLHTHTPIHRGTPGHTWSGSGALGPTRIFPGGARRIPAGGDMAWRRLLLPAQDPPLHPKVSGCLPVRLPCPFRAFPRRSVPGGGQTSAPVSPGRTGLSVPL